MTAFAQSRHSNDSKRIGANGRNRPHPDVRVAIELGPYQAEIVQNDTFAIALVMGASESLKRLHQHQYQLLIGGVILAATEFSETISLLAKCIASRFSTIKHVT